MTKKPEKTKKSAYLTPEKRRRYMRDLMRRIRAKAKANQKREPKGLRHDRP